MTNNRITNQPRQLSRPMSRQAFRPGQWNGFSSGGIHKTYIQNNFYGAQTSYRGWGDAWASFPPPQMEQPKMSWLGWLGLGTGLLGGILNLFGVGNKKTEQGAEAQPQPQPQPQNNSQLSQALEQINDRLDNLQNQIAAKAQPAAAPAPAAAPVTTAQPKEPKETTPDTFDWGTDFNSNCRDVDENGNDKTKPIKGTVHVTKKDSEANKAPKEFTITTASGNIYKFQKMDGSDGDNIKYKCISCTTRNGATTEFSKGNIYKCEMEDGKPVLRQHEGDAGSGKRVGEE